MFHDVRHVKRRRQALLCVTMFGSTVTSVCSIEPMHGQECVGGCTARPECLRKSTWPAPLCVLFPSATWGLNLSDAQSQNWSPKGCCWPFGVAAQRGSSAASLSRQRLKVWEPGCDLPTAARATAESQSCKLQVGGHGRAAADGFWCMSW